MFGARFFSARYWSSRYWSAIGLTVTFVGPIVLPMANLRSLIASTSEFQAWTSTANQTAAEARIYIGSESSPVRPFCAISVEELELVRISGGASGFFVPSGALRVLWEAEITGADLTSQEDAENTFLGDIDTVMSAVLDASGLSDAISLDAFDLIEDPSRSDEDEADEYYQAKTLARWRTV